MQTSVNTTATLPRPGPRLLVPLVALTIGLAILLAVSMSSGPAQVRTTAPAAQATGSAENLEAYDGRLLHNHGVKAVPTRNAPAPTKAQRASAEGFHHRR